MSATVFYCQKGNKVQSIIPLSLSHLLSISNEIPQSSVFYKTESEIMSAFIHLEMCYNHVWSFLFFGTKLDDIFQVGIYVTWTCSHPLVFCSPPCFLLQQMLLVHLVFLPSPPLELTISSRNSISLQCQSIVSGFAYWTEFLNQGHCFNFCQKPQSSQIEIKNVLLFLKLYETYLSPWASM